MHVLNALKNYLFDIYLHSKQQNLDSSVVYLVLHCEFRFDIISNKIVTI